MPDALVAVTEQRYGLPMMRPVTVSGDVAPEETRTDAPKRQVAV